MRARAVPHMARAFLLSLAGFTQTLPSAWLISTSLVARKSRLPNLPFAETRPPLMAISTPAGTSTGFFPIRDILSSSPSPASSEDAAEHFATPVGRARFLVGHEPARRRQAGDAEAVVEPRQLLDIRNNPADRPRPPKGRGHCRGK